MVASKRDTMLLGLGLKDDEPARKDKAPVPPARVQDATEKILAAMASDALMPAFPIEAAPVAKADPKSVAAKVASVPAATAENEYAPNAEDYRMSVDHAEGAVSYHSAHARDHLRPLMLAATPQESIDYHAAHAQHHVEKILTAQDRLAEIKRRGATMRPAKEE